MSTADRTLPEIADLARAVTCGHCWAPPSRPCSTGRPGLHLARFARARRRGLVSDSEMCTVLDAAGDVFEPATVICADVAVTA